MTNINFAHQDVLYHVFDINLLSSVKDADSSNSILNLREPQLVHSSDGSSPGLQDLIQSSAVYHPVLRYNNSNSVAAPPSQDSFDGLNSMMITQPLLNQRPKIRRRKHQRLKKHWEDDYASMDNKGHESLTSAKSTKVYDEQLTNLSQGLDLSTKLQCKSVQTVVIEYPLTVSDLSKLVSISESEIIKMLFLKGIIVTINEMISIDTATSVAEHYGCIVENYDHKMHILSSIDNATSLDTSAVNTQTRVPIITIAGHLNHGKTSLLHAIQKNTVLERQNDGITQLIKAHEVYIYWKGEAQKVILLDTPGHEAYANMRLLSIRITDFVILVVAADNVIGAQTVESIRYIQRANIPVLIVINKIDKVSIDIEQIKNDFLNHDAIPKEWKNSVPIVPISALTGKNIDMLFSHIMALVKKCDLKRNPFQNATGIIINSFLDKNKGPSANVIVQNGALSVGDFVVAGNSFGKVRSIKNSQNVMLEYAFPSSVVDIWGLSQVPIVGCVFKIVKNEKSAKKIVKEHQKRDNKFSLQQQINYKMAAKKHTGLYKTDLVQQVNIVLKTGTQGAIEAILSSFSNIDQSEVTLNIMSIATGIITETDVKLAIISKSTVIGFDTIVTAGARLIAKQHKISINEYKIIDDLLHHVKKCMLLSSHVENTEKLVCTALVRSIFKLTIGIVAGCVVESGKANHDSTAEILRNKIVIHKGKLKSLKHVKTNISEIKQGEEFGVSVIGFDAWQVNDRIRFYNVD
uniref:Translation initiation factor IF-2, chloroplastic n=1 Tax=Hildenbrandia rivularis TaxID=135206 RepID=A0A1C9CFD3_9FLOR|nr:translation initiation factor 2 [Hildenbrandia rivularis]AOM67093.1 translation initiation factor 2 [Hildenbrandia rivularis]